MAGTNPFRRSLTASAANRDASQDVSKDAITRNEKTNIVPPINTDTAKTKTVKTVRIISPHSASSETDSALVLNTSITGRHLPASPPPEEPASDGAESSDEDNPFQQSPPARIFQPTSAKVNERAELHIEKQTPESQTSLSNPFSRTLATIENTSGSPDSPETAKLTDDGRVQYDVNSFTKLLLTGQRLQNSSSSIKSSDGAVDDGRKPSDEATAVSPTNASELNRMGTEPLLLRESSMNRSDRKKPAVPRPRHGKPTKDKPDSDSYQDAQSTQLDSSLHSDNRRPESRDGPRPADTFADEVSNSNTADQGTPSSKKSAPLPPPSRKSGPGRPTSLSGGPRTASTPESRAPDDPTLSANKSAPPPPRRWNTVSRHESSSSVHTSSSTTLSSEQSAPTEPFSDVHPLGRSPSTASGKRGSHSSLQQQQAVQSPMPPPPPPRRRGSSHGSNTVVRHGSTDDRPPSSSQRHPDGSTASASSQQQQNTIAESQTSRKDVMADLSALQREVDELRQRMGQ